MVGGKREEIGSVARDDVCNGNTLDADCNGYDCDDDWCTGADDEITGFTCDGI